MESGGMGSYILPIHVEFASKCNSLFSQSIFDGMLFNRNNTSVMDKTQASNRIHIINFCDVFSTEKIEERNVFWNIKKYKYY